jgi:hypothetical protein
VPFVTSGRNINLKWRDTSGTEFVDTITLYTYGSAPSAPSAGGRGILRVSPNPVASGGTVIASWSGLPNFVSGTFDKGDGGGFKGPIAGSMNVSVDGITSNRTLTVKWTDTSGAEQTDSVQILVGGSSSASTGSTSSSDPECNASNPHWRGPTYPFCVKQDLEWDGPPTWKVGFNENKTITLRWYVYGIDGIRLRMDPSGQQCPAGSSGFDRAINGSDGNRDGTSSFNVNELKSGGYKFELFVTKGGKVYGHNEKFLCVGT